MFVCISRHFKRYSERGNVLLSTILIMGLSLNIGLVIAVLALSGFSRTGKIKSQSLSYYAAESGVESGLYEVRKGGSEVASVNINAENATLGTEWESKGEISTQSIQEDLEQDRSIVLYLYDPEKWACGISSLEITWFDTCNNLSTLEILEASPIQTQEEFDSPNKWDNAVLYTPYRSQPDIIQNITNDLPAVTLLLNPLIAYAIKFTALDCYVNYLKIEGKAYNATTGFEEPANLNLENIITSTGTAGEVKQTIRVSM